MKYRIIGLLLMVSTLHAGAAAVVTRYGCNVNSTPYNGAVYEQPLTPENRDHIAKWNPETEAPGISMSEAILRVQTLLETVFPDDTWIFHGFHLSHFGAQSATDTWWYVVQFRSEKNSVEDMLPFYFSIHLSSDGWIPGMVPVEASSSLSDN